MSNQLTTQQYNGGTFTFIGSIEEEVPTSLQRWNKIKQIRDNKIQTGGYKVGLNWFHSDTFSRTQQLGLVLMQANIPTGLKWKTMQGTFVDMTSSLAASIFAAAALKDSEIFAYAEYLKQNETLDIYQGWPLVYQDTI